jgi:hypothetical protein
MFAPHFSLNGLTNWLKWISRSAFPKALLPTCANSWQEIMMFLQALPTKDWTEKDIELLRSEAFIWQSLFQDSSAHLRPAGGASSGSEGVR